MSPQPPLATVRGTAEREIPPDRAVFSVEIRVFTTSAQKAREAVAFRQDRITQIATEPEYGVSRNETSWVNFYPVYDDANRVKEYCGAWTGEIEVAEFSQLGQLAAALSEVPETSVNGPQWTILATNPAYRAVRTDAIANAHEVAADYAAAVGAEVVGLAEISDLNDQLAPYGERVMMAKGAGDGAERQWAPAFDVAPRPQKVTGTVTVRFILSQPKLVRGK